MANEFIFPPVSCTTREQIFLQVFGHNCVGTIISIAGFNFFSLVSFAFQFSPPFYHSSCHLLFESERIFWPTFERRQRRGFHVIDVTPHLQE